MQIFRIRNCLALLLVSAFQHLPLLKTGVQVTLCDKTLVWEYINVIATWSVLESAEEVIFRAAIKIKMDRIRIGREGVFWSDRTKHMGNYNI